MRPKSAAPYTHRRHVGNVGDVLKHTALVALLEALRESGRRISYVESHAGEGLYELQSTGEWTEGYGKLLSSRGAHRSPLLEEYSKIVLSCSKGHGAKRTYPGSPLLAAKLLGPSDTLALWEIQPDAVDALHANISADPRACVTLGDGLATLSEEVSRAESQGRQVLACVDPPFSDKAEWSKVADALIECYEVSKRAVLLLWYPIKSLTRPNAMLARLDKAGVSGVAIELVTTPLALQKNRLNGSGVFLARPPKGLVSQVLSVISELGELCSTHEGRWSARAVAWGDEPPLGSRKSG